MAATKLVRIKPSNNREVHVSNGVTMRKSDGWVEVPTGTADALALERMNDLNPTASPPVFDVMEKEEAKAVEEAENEKIEPAGTVDNPKVKIPLPPANDEGEEGSPARRRGR